MYVSVRNLQENRGVDPEIARFFVDRKVPPGNLFWKNRLLYVNRGNGYLSIPIYYDLLFRIGLPKSKLLEESQICLMEGIMHEAIRAEYGEIGFKEQIDRIQDLLQGKILNPVFYGELTDYLAQPVLGPRHRLGLAVPALNRADSFLFILCNLPMTEEQTTKAIRYWYALHGSFLLMDDIADYGQDKKNKEENALIELGDGAIGSARAFDLLREQMNVLREINLVLAEFLERGFEELQALMTKLT
jgi:hypothetical protein